MSNSKYLQVKQTEESIEILNGLSTARVVFEPEMSTIEESRLITDPFRAAVALSAQVIVDHNNSGINDFDLMLRQYEHAQVNARTVVESGGAIALEAVLNEEKVA